jgi:hypothetical protein
MSEIDFTSLWGDQPVDPVVLENMRKMLQYFGTTLPLHFGHRVDEPSFTHEVTKGIEKFVSKVAGFEVFAVTKDPNTGVFTFVDVEGRDVMMRVDAETGEFIRLVRDL